MKARGKAKNTKLDFKPGKVLEEFDIIDKKGKELHIVFRYPKPTDVDQALKFINVAIKENEFLRMDKKITRKEESDWLKETIKKLQKGEKLFAFLEIDGIISGSSTVEKGMGRQNHVGSIGIAIMEKYTNLGIGTRMINYMLNESLKIGIEVIKISHYENNVRAKHVYEKLGFKHIGVIPKAMKKLDGSYHDESLMYKIMV